MFLALRSEVRSLLALNNLERKFPEVLPEFTRLVASICIVPENLSLPCPERLAEKDRPIFRAAYGCKADVLLTGDLRDFGFLMNAPELASGILIQTVAARPRWEG